MAGARAAISIRCDSEIFQHLACDVWRNASPTNALDPAVFPDFAPVTSASSGFELPLDRDFWGGPAPRSQARPSGDPMLTLGQAAKLTGTSKTTITRAIKAGRMSATRRDDGGYSIDPAELARVYTLTPATPETVTTAGDVVHRATDQRDPAAPPVTPPDVAARLAAVEAELRGLRELADELRRSRDQWQEQAARATNALTDQRRPWWRRLAG